ncbi:MAG: hypothetical protein WCF04_05900 [Candidatus Nanopelagicales bacterium]
MTSLADAISALTAQPSVSTLRGTVASTTTVTLADSTTITVPVWAGGPPTVGQPCLILAGRGSLIGMPIVDPAATLATDAELAAAIATCVAIAGDTMTGDLKLLSSSPEVRLDIPSLTPNTRGIWFQQDGAPRWIVYADGTAETGSDSGSLLHIRKYTDAGVAADCIVINRADGVVQMPLGADLSPVAGAVRVFSRGSDSIANSSATPFTGGWSAAAGDGGNSLLAYSGGIITVPAGYYDCCLELNWSTNSAGERRLELLLNGSVAHRVNQSAVGTNTGPFQVLTLTSQYLAAGTTLQAQCLQTSGSSLTTSSGKWTLRRVLVA